MTDVPDGFVRHTRSSPLTTPWEPLWFREADGALGLWIAEAHCNARGLAHGGLIAALADKAGSTLGFATCRVSADGALCATARATFAMGAV
ncbi:MAG: hypothetical protein JO290_01100 [Sphingomonadaceae bacterium]|nr:hypothetical protein [Sphingomonadaceae bacterium]